MSQTAAINLHEVCLLDFLARLPAVEGTQLAMTSPQPVAHPPLFGQAMGITLPTAGRNLSG